MHTEIIKQINDLPIAERVEIIEEVSRSVRRDLHRDEYANGDSDSNKVKSRDEIISERKRAVDRLRGIAAAPGETPPTDEEWREERTNYLLEKHK